MKIGQYLAKLWTRVYIVCGFLGHLVHCESKKGDTILLSIFLLNIDRFSPPYSVGNLLGDQDFI